VKILEAIRKFFEELTNPIRSIKWFSWETLLCLSLFSWLVSLAVSSEVLAEILARIAWVFLTLGTAWALKETKVEIFGLTISLGPWVTGALVVGLVFEGFPNEWSLRLATWPLISAAIALTPKLTKHGWDLINPTIAEPQKLATDRQELILISLFSILLSCWFQFHFLVQYWVRQYPTLLAEDFSRSGFVFKLSVGNPPLSRGAQILGTIDGVLQQSFAPLSWNEIEQRLLRIDDYTDEWQERAIARLPTEGRAEDDVWDLQAQILPGQPQYTARFREFWGGPSSRPQGFYTERTCLIRKPPISSIVGPRDTQPVVASQIECSPVADTQWID
jgi:Family of unknown function (DUF5357)